MSSALYYPWIDIRHEAWLKTSLLYWDSVRTIVPESVDAPYSTETGRALQQADFLIPLRVQSGMDEIEDLAVDVLTYLESAEGTALLTADRRGRMHDIHIDKLPYELGQFADLHPEKLPSRIRNIFRDIAAESDRGGDWMRVDERFANFYMTLLATRLAERVGARLLTSFPAADRLAVSARFDAQLNGVIPWSMHPRSRHWREYEAFGMRHRMPHHLAPGMLANLALERIAVAPDTSVDQLINFREKYRDELAQFRTKVEQLASSVDEDLPMEALRERVSSIYTDQVVPAVASLKAALEGRRIKWLGDGFLKVGLLSVGSSSALVATGLDVPYALLAGAGVSLIATGMMYNVDRREAIRSNPFAYLLSVESELA